MLGQARNSDQATAYSPGGVQRGAPPSLPNPPQLLLMPITAKSSLTVGLDALRGNPLRTLLSTLGVVMGVGAMVSVLSMGDGVEAFAREQIEQTTDLLGVSVSPSTNTLIDGQFVRLKLQTSQIGGHWPVASIAVESSSVGDRDEAELEGLLAQGRVRLGRR